MRSVRAVGTTKPMSSFSVVVFPAPVGPRKAKIAPSSTLRCNGFKACFGFLRQKPTVYVFSNPRISIAAMRDRDGSPTKIIFKIQSNREWQGGFGGHERQLLREEGSLASAIGHKEHRKLQHTGESVLPAPTSACCAHSTEGAPGRARLGDSPAVDGFFGAFC